MTRNPDKSLNDAILKVVNEKKPQSVRELVTILKQVTTCSESEVVEAILKLQAQGDIELEDQHSNSRNLAAFATGEGLWYLLTIALGVVTSSLVFTVSANMYPLVYLKNFLGIIFVLFLPGYAVTKALFTKNILGKATSKELETIARVALSVGLSIALVSIVGLFLFYSPWGLSLPAIVTTLFILTALSATVGLLRSAGAH